MKKFTGRQDEQKKLQTLIKSDSASCVVIRGRRRIGKSRLVEKAAENTTLYKFSGLAPDKKLDSNAQRENFSFQLMENFKIPKTDTSDWNYLFSALKESLPSNECVILFDEISWMGKGDDTFLPKLKNLWDDFLSKRPNIVFVMCGSVSSWIDKNILSSTSFFGRIHEIITLDELSLNESLTMLRSDGFLASVFEEMLILSITGGVPWYIEQFRKGDNTLSRINELCFEKDGLFTNEYERIFHDLFAQRSNSYSSIISAISSDSKTYKEISEISGVPSSGMLTDYLNDLKISGFVSEDSSWSIKTAKEKMKMRYRLKDNYLRFYLKTIEPNLQKIQRNRLKEQSVLSLAGFHTLLGLQFENLVLHNRNTIIKELDIKHQDVIQDNPYWQAPTQKRQGCQIDYLIQTELKVLFVCEIKFTKNQVGLNVISEVKEKIKRLEVPRGFTCVPVLIYFGEISSPLDESTYFYRKIDFTTLMAPDS